jgi:hypothetical protein
MAAIKKVLQKVVVENLVIVVPPGGQFGFCLVVFEQITNVVISSMPPSPHRAFAVIL